MRITVAQEDSFVCWMAHDVNHSSSVCLFCTPGFSAREIIVINFKTDMFIRREPLMVHIHKKNVL